MNDPQINEVERENCSNMDSKGLWELRRAQLARGVEDDSIKETMLRLHSEG